jgi:drug/metabolite transporter (DMT)-like permease
MFPRAQKTGLLMPLPVLAAVLSSVLLSALAQIVLKAGMTRPDIAQALAAGGAGPVALAVATQPLVLAGLGLYGLGMLVWLFVLSRIDVSLAYPFVSLGIVVTMALGHLVFGEVISLARALGAGLVIAGILVLATG